MGLNKPITVGGGLTAAEVQTIIDAQTTAIAVKVDAQTNTLKTDIPSSISGGASISDIKAALDEKLPQYQNRGVVKSSQYGIVNGGATQYISEVDSSKCLIDIIGGNILNDAYNATSRYSDAHIVSFDNTSFVLSEARQQVYQSASSFSKGKYYYRIVEFY